MQLLIWNVKLPAWTFLIKNLHIRIIFRVACKIVIDVKTFHILISLFSFPNLKLWLAEVVKENKAEWDSHGRGIFCDGRKYWILNYQDMSFWTCKLEYIPLFSPKATFCKNHNFEKAFEKNVLSYVTNICRYTRA